MAFVAPALPCPTRSTALRSSVARPSPPGSTLGRCTAASPRMVPRSDSAVLDVRTPSMLYPATPTPRPMTGGAYSFDLFGSPAAPPFAALPLSGAFFCEATGLVPEPRGGKWIGSDITATLMETCFEDGLIDQGLPYDIIDGGANNNKVEGSTLASETSAYAADPSWIPSAGSVLHGTGQCLPCAWAWRPGGCKADASCNYCHLCPEGELKRRKKEKVAAIRAGERMAAQAARHHHHAGSGSGGVRPFRN